MPGPFDFDTDADPRPRRYEVTHRQGLSVLGLIKGGMMLAGTAVLLLVAFYLALPIIDGVIRVKKAADKVEERNRTKSVHSSP